MNIWDILLIIGLTAAVFFAVRHVIRTRKSGGCSCGGGSACGSSACGSCPYGGSCSKRK